MRSLSPWTLALLAILGAVYAVAARFFTLDFASSTYGISVIRSIDHAVPLPFPIMRLLLGHPYLILLLPVTLVLAFLRVRVESTLAILMLYGIIMAATAYVLLHQWARVGMGLWLQDLFAIIFSVALQLVLYVIVVRSADKAATRREHALERK